MINVSLDKLCNRAGVSNRKLSIISGLRPNTILELSKGRAKRVDFDTIDKILNALNSDMEERGLNTVFSISDLIEYEYNGEK